MEEADRDRVEEVQLLPAPAPAHDQSGLLEQAQVLRDGDPGHVVAGGQRHQGLAVLLEQRVEQGSPGRVGKRPEHCLHGDQNRKPNGFLSSWSDDFVVTTRQDVG